MGLQELRVQINNIDEQLEDLLQCRLGIIKEVAELKKKNKRPIEDLKREEKILKGLKARVQEGFEPYVEQMFKAMFDISKKYQRELIEK